MHPYFNQYGQNQLSAQYLLTQLKMQGLPMAQLQSVFDAVKLSRVLYAASAWRGYLSAREFTSLQQLFAKAKRWNIVAINYHIDGLLDNCNRTLFRSSLYIAQCLHHLLPDKRDHTYSMTLRPVSTIMRYLASSFCMRETHKSFII